MAGGLLCDDWPSTISFLGGDAIAMGIEGYNYAKTMSLCLYQMYEGRGVLHA